MPLVRIDLIEGRSPGERIAIGEAVHQAMTETIDVPADANLPRDYVARDDVRMEAYRRLAAVTTADDVDDVRAEWEDRYGPPPPPAALMMFVLKLPHSPLSAVAMITRVRLSTLTSRMASMDEEIDEPPELALEITLRIQQLAGPPDLPAMRGVLDTEGPDLGHEHLRLTVPVIVVGTSFVRSSGVASVV